MKVITSIPKMQEFSRQVRGAGLQVGFVPTMGFLHEGHIDLVRRARAESDVVVVSIFVNPAQFDRKDDFERYPRDVERDRDMLARERVDVLFMPAAEQVYGAGAATKVHVEGLTTTLCGPQRPGHFDGVATIVAALFNMVAPDRAWFGEKDYQQLQSVRRMVHDLHFPVQIIGVPTTREADGLAMSSRNARLTAAERALAPAVHRALRAAADAYLAGEKSAAALVDAARAVLDHHTELKVEYLEVVDGETLQPVDAVTDASVMATAVWLGNVRLIDNVLMRRAAETRSAPATEAAAPFSRAHEPALEAHALAPRRQGPGGVRRGAASKLDGGLDPDA
jgi:pantoate--beta-alanine ligase